MWERVIFLGWPGAALTQRTQEWEQIEKDNEFPFTAGSVKGSCGLTVEEIH